MASMTIEEAYDDYLRRQAARRETEIETAYRDYQRRQDEKNVSEGINGLSQFVSDTYHSGLGGIQTGMANMNDALAHGVRSLPFMSGIADWIGEGADWWDAKARANAQEVKNHNLWTSSINALGSTAPSMAASLALAATGNMASAGQMLMPAGLMDLSQKTLSGAMMYRSGEEALGNAGRTYREAIHEGRTPEQAQSQANRQLAAELPMNVFFDKAGIFGDAWEGIQSPLKRGLAMTLSEVIGQGGQEVGQDVIGDAAAATRDQGVPEYLRAIGENVTNAEYLKQEMKDTFLPTGLSSLIGAALGLGVRSMRNNRGSNVDNFARGVPDTGTQQAIAEIMQPVEEEQRRKKLDDWIPESQGIVPGNVAPQMPQKMSDMFKPAEPQPVIPESAKPLPGAVPETEAPVPSGKKAEGIMAANVEKVAEMQAAIETPEATTQSIAETPEPVELQPVPSVQEEVGEDTGETLDDLRAQMAEEYQNVQRMDTEEREDLPPAATDSTFAKAAKTPAPKKTYRAGNSSTSGNRQNAVLNVSTGVITISDGNPKPNKKDNRSSYTVTLRELDDIYNSPYIYNKEAALYKMVKERDYAAVEKWIEGSANEKLKRRRREIWENSTIYGKYSALTGHVIYDQIAALKSVYEKYNKDNPNRKMEKSTRQPGNPLFIERAETNMPQTQQSVPASTLSGLMEQSGRRYEQGPNVQNVIGRAPAKNKCRSFELGADVESASQTLGEIHMANSGRDFSVREEGDPKKVAPAFDLPAGQKRIQLAKIRKAKPIELTGNEISFGATKKESRDIAEKYALALRTEEGHPFVNRDTGMEIKLGAKAIREVLRHDLDNPDHILSVVAIPEIAESSVYVGSAKNENVSQRPGIVRYDYYLSKLNVQGRKYAVKSVIAEDRNGNRYYDHKLTAIEKDGSLPSVRPVTSGGSESKPSFSVNYDTRLFDLLQDLQSTETANDNRDFSVHNDLPQDKEKGSPENGDFGPIWRGYRDEAAVEKLLKERQGEVVGAMSDPRLGENSSIDFVWGQEGDPQREYSGGYGLAHVKAKHGIEMARNVPRIIRSGRISFETNDRVYFGSPQGRVVLKQQWKDNAKNWVLTSYVPKDTKKVPRSAQDPETGGRTEESLSSSDGKPFDSRIPQSSNESNRDFSVRNDLPQVKVTAAPGSKSAGTLIRVKDIYDKLRAIAPVRKGVSAPANVAGYYTPLTGVARERHWGDFSTALHEIGHALDYKLGLRESVCDAETSRQLYDELCELGKATSPQNVTTLYEKLHGRYMHAPGAEAHGPDVSEAALKFEGAQRYLMKEGIAEYFRGYAFNPDLMEVVAPEYTKMFREALEAHEEYQQPVSELFDAVRSYSELTPEQKLRAGMIRGDEKVKNQKGARAAVAEAWNGFRQKFDDQLRYLEQMQNLLRDRVRELAKEHGGRYADMLQHGELKDEFAVYDMLRTMPGYMGKAKRDVLALLEPVKKIGDEAYDALTSYMKAMRALDYWENGLEPGIGLTRAETTAIVNRTRHENPELVRIVETIAKAYETMVERTLIDSGVWSREQYEEYKKRWPHYVPFVRVNEDGSVTAPTSRGRGVVNLSNQVKRATGVGAEDAVIDIKDPFETMIKNALVFNQLAEKNRAGRALVNAALADPAIFAGLIEPVRGGERSRDTFTVWIDGKRMAFTGDKKLLDALASMEQAAGIGNPIFGTLDRAAQGAANLLKLGATRANPAFILVNFMRDAMYSSLTNGAKGARSMPFFGTVKGLLMQTAKDEASKQRIVDALDHGLAYSGITELGLNVSEKGISKYVGKAVHGDKSFLKKLASAWDSTIGKYNEMIELAPKFAEYERLVKEGYPKRYAARMAREVNLDFSRGGQWGKVWNRYTAFFNPAVQGTSKLVRTAAAHPGRFAARTAMYVILPSLISWMAGRDDDEYKRISRNIKDRYWVFKIGSTWLRLPKPELAGLFSSAVERVLDAAFEHDPMAFHEFGRSVWEGFSPNLLPTFIEPILEHRMGKTFFYDSPLIPPQLENLPPELQFTKNTSSMAKFLGKAWGVSPILIDHYVSSYGGGVGEYLSKTPDILLKPQEEAKKLSEKPLFSRFTVDPNRNSESLAKFYDLRKQATTVKNAYDVRRKMGEQPEYSAGVHMAKAFDQSARKLSDWRKNIAAYQQSKTLTPERKREIIDRIRLRMNQEAETAVKNYFTVKEKLDQRKR